MLKNVTWSIHYHHSNHKHVPGIFYYTLHPVSTTDYIYFRPKLAAYINTSPLILNQSQSPSSIRDECMCILGFLVHIYFHYLCHRYRLQAITQKLRSTHLRLLQAVYLATTTIAGVHEESSKVYMLIFILTIYLAHPGYTSS